MDAMGNEEIIPRTLSKQRVLTFGATHSLVADLTSTTSDGSLSLLELYNEP